MALVREPQVSDVFFTPDLVTGGVAAKGSVMLDGLASYSTFVPVSSSNMSVVKAVNVTVAKKKNSAPLSFITYPVGKPTAVTIQAGPVSTELTVMPINVSLVKVTTPVIRSGGSTVVTISLAKTAGVETTVNLSASVAGVLQIPAMVTIPKGKSSVTFTATALTTSARKTTSIQAETDGNIKSAGVTVNP